jgi:hypothetical protein
VRLAAVLGVAIVATTLDGCGYSTGSLMPEGVESISVDLAKNDTFYRGDEFIYTRYLTEELTRKTDVQIRTRRRCDAILCTRLKRLTRVPLVEGVHTDKPLEEGLVGSVEVTLTHACSGRILTQFTLERRSEAILPRGEDLVRERDKLMRELAQDTVVRLQGASLVAKRGYAIGAWDTRPASRPAHKKEGLFH